MTATSGSRDPRGGDPVERPSDIRLAIYGVTDVGRTRSHNEDSFLVLDLADGAPLEFPAVLQRPIGPRGHLFMVADGMGGAAAGELASETAIHVVRQHMHDAMRDTARLDDQTFVAILEEATHLANQAIHEEALHRPELRGMGTTSTIAALRGDILYLSQVGDSRAYLVRDGAARPITKDQSLMQRLIDAGEITEEEAEVSERRNIILQALGPEPAIRVDLTFQPLRRGDVLVLCSDGLSGQVRAREIAECVTQGPDLQHACHRLVALANERGGPDNITVVAARFDGSALAAPGQADIVGHQVYGGAASVAAAAPPPTPSPAPAPVAPAPATSSRLTPSTTPQIHALPAERKAARASTGRVLLVSIAVLALAAGAVLAWRAYQATLR